MANIGNLNVKEYVGLASMVRHSPKGYLWSSYDKEADVLYVNFKKPSRATDTEMTDDDIVIRYEDDEVIGMTILNVSKRKGLL